MTTAPGTEAGMAPATPPRSAAAEVRVLALTCGGSCCFTKKALLEQVAPPLEPALRDSESAAFVGFFYLEFLLCTFF